MRVLCLEEGVRKSMVRSWVREGHAPSEKAHKAALERLLELRIWFDGDRLFREEDEREENGVDEKPAGIAGSLAAQDVGQGCYRMNPVFERSLQRALCNSYDGSPSLGAVSPSLAWARTR